MHKLKRRIFLIVFSILTISVLSFITFFNTMSYTEQKRSIKNSLEIVNKRDNGIPKNDVSAPPPKKDNDKVFDENIKFMDSTIYTVLIDENDNIKEIINHSNKELDTIAITNLAKEILSSNNKKDIYIPNLYVGKYSYAYQKDNSLTIIDIANAKSNLLNSLLKSFLIFLILEVIIIFISHFLATHISKPVEESFEKQKQFVADASHELKTPLSVIMASIEVYENNPKETKWLTNIKEEATRMNFLLTDLLDLASSEKKETLNLTKENLSKTALLAVLTFEGRAYEKNIKLKYDIADDIYFIFDENRLKQLIEILLDNAIKHSKAKSTVTFTLTENKNNIIMEVTNKGEAISKEDEERIFERFYRVDASRNRTENRYGLGLAIAKNIVLNHNGTISAHSADGLTTFKVLFKK